jgi:hypothetical protein
MFAEMFDTFSQRARQAVFAARWRAGQRGADEMCVEDLVVGLIIEDQGMIESLVIGSLPGRDAYGDEFL